MINKYVSKVFDYIAQRFAPDEKSIEKLIENFFSEGEIKDKSILDAGCGSGVASKYFAKKDAKKVIGIDISYISLKCASKLVIPNNDNVIFTQANLLNLPLRDASFDIVFAVGILPYIEDIETSLKELTRVLEKDGTILILSLRRTALDNIFEIFRKLFNVIPSQYVFICSKILANLLIPISPWILKKRELKGGKTLQQTIIEAFFVPVRLRKFKPEEIEYYLKKWHVSSNKLIPPFLSFCSPATVFVIKGTKDRASLKD